MKNLMCKRFLILTVLFRICVLYGSESSSLAQDPEHCSFSKEEISRLRENLKLKRALPKNVFLIGHRGMGATNANPNPPLFPENTFVSFKESIIHGADGIEFDVFKSKDGYLFVIHDDELWKNVYGSDRVGDFLPLLETRSTFRVSQKTCAEISQLWVGPNRETAPLLADILRLIEEANHIRRRFGEQPLFLNIDIKQPEVSLTCLEFIDQYLKSHPTSSIEFNHIFFTSSNTDVLNIISKLMRNLEMYNASLIPQFSTKQIYGSSNVGDYFIIKNPKIIEPTLIREIEIMGKELHINGIDCVLWDLNPFLFHLCALNGWSLHLASSNFNLCENYNKFSIFVLYISMNCKVFIKTDHLYKTISALSHQFLSESEKEAKDAFIKNLPLKKPMPFSVIHRSQ